MKVLMLWSAYDAALNAFYHKYPICKTQSFEEQKCKIFNEHLLGWPTSLACYMDKKDLDVQFIIQNNEYMQKMWADEFEFQYSNEYWDFEIVAKQIETFQPDCLIIANPNEKIDALIEIVKYSYKKLVFYIGHDISNYELIAKADQLVTINRSYVLNYYPELDNVVEIGAAFSECVLGRIGGRGEKKGVVFAGSLTRAHADRVSLLAYLIKNGVEIEIYSDCPHISFFSKGKRIVTNILKCRGVKVILHSIYELLITSVYEKDISVIKESCRNPVFGIDYYSVLASAKVCLNCHIGLSGEFSGNMRMFEVTGIGTCLLTDDKVSNQSLFSVNEEILVYTSKEDLLSQLKKIPLNSNNVDVVAMAGQKKTLKKYSIANMFDKLKTVFEGL